MDTEIIGAVEPGTAAWWTGHHERLARRRPRAGGLTIERIVDEAIAILDADGFDGLTVRALAGRLGTSSASLYRHVASVDELTVLAADRVLGDVVLPDRSAPGRDRVLGLAAEFRKVLTAHPGVVPALRSAPMMGPNALRGATFALDSLTDGGHPPEVARPACLALIDYVLGSVFFDTAGGAEGIGDNDSDAVFERAIRTFLDGLEVARDPSDASNAR